MKKVMITLCMALASAATFAQHDHASKDIKKEGAKVEPAFQDKKLNAAYVNYIQLKMHWLHPILRKVKRLLPNYKNH